MTLLKSLYLRNDRSELHAVFTAGTQPGFHPGGADLARTQGIPTKNRKLLGFGPLFLGAGQFIFYFLIFATKCYLMFRSGGGGAWLAPVTLPHAYVPVSLSGRSIQQKLTATRSDSFEGSAWRVGVQRGGCQNGPPKLRNDWADCHQIWWLETM